MRFSRSKKAKMPSVRSEGDSNSRIAFDDYTLSRDGLRCGCDVLWSGFPRFFLFWSCFFCLPLSHELLDAAHHQPHLCDGVGADRRVIELRLVDWLEYDCALLLSPAYALDGAHSALGLDAVDLPVNDVFRPVMDFLYNDLISRADERVHTASCCPYDCRCSGVLGHSHTADYRCGAVGVHDGVAARKVNVVFGYRVGVGHRLIVRQHFPLTVEQPISISFWKSFQYSS